MTCIDLKKSRETLLISKTELSKLTGLSLSTISRIEDGNSCRSLSRTKIKTALQSAAAQSLKVTT